MDHAAGVGVGEGLADGDEAAEEFAEDDGVGEGVVFGDMGVEGAAADEAHDVIGVAGGVGAEGIDRDDRRVFELAGDLGFIEEAFFEGFVVGMLGEDLLKGDFALDEFIAGEIDEAQAAAGVLADDGEGHGRGEEGGVHFSGGGGGEGAAEGLLGGFVGHGGTGCRGPRDGSEVHGLSDFTGRRRRSGGRGVEAGNGGWGRGIDGGVVVVIDGLFGVEVFDLGGARERRASAGRADEGRGTHGSGVP